jgi:hypothetical protein
MATQPFTSLFSLAPKQLSQLINPLYWLNSGTDQIGLINISGSASAKPEVEADIIENVATYGRQLGRITDVLQAVLAQMHPDRWPAAEQEAVRQFRDMAAKIAAVKAGYLAPTQKNVDQLIAGINSLKESDMDEYVRIKNELREKLFDGDKASRSSEVGRSRGTAKKG